MERRYLKKESRGLPGGPNEVFTYVTGVFSVDGYREDSNDVNKSVNVIPSGNITMKEKNGAPLKKGPILGIDNLGNKKAMIPGNDYSFPGDYVFEIPMKQDGGEETSWTDYFNPMNWGVSSYDNKGSFGNAFAAARKAGEDEFMWHGNRYTTKMKGEDAKKVVSKPVSNMPVGKGIDSSLLMRQAYRESTFNPKAVSPKGYKGLTQVGDAVIKDYKIAKNIDGEVNPFNAKTAIDIQRYAMNELYNASFINRPDQSEQVRLAKTLAAYNWGRGNLKNYLDSQKAKGVDIYNSLAWINSLPKETRNYIDDILLKKDQTFNQNFNSAVNNVKFQPYVKLYKMDEGGEPSSKEYVAPTNNEYVVQKGDTLSKIAAQNNTSIASIMRNNQDIKNPNVISVNQKIIIPTGNSTAPVEEVYKDWDTIRNQVNKVNRMTDEQKIVSYHKNTPEETYLIVDKKNAQMKLYTGGSLTRSYEVGIGEKKSDAQTVTKVINGKTNWNAGNKSTGAGIYTISRIDPASKEYYNEPAFNLKNENGIEVATTIHGTPMARRSKFDNGNIEDNRMSNGCINGKCEDLRALYGILDVNTKVYILPEDQGNSFQIIDGKPALKVSSQNRQSYNSYVDSTGKVQKGQGANQTVNTLVYKPIKANFNEKAFKDKVFTAFDFNDEDELKNTTKPFINALTTGKKDVMKAAKISSDVYNELAKMAFGIYGTESNFGDTHSAVGNFGRAVNKWFDEKSSSSPDYKSKYGTYGAKQDTRSVGLTQMRWSYLNEDEKKALAAVGIKSNKDFMDPKKAAIGTVTILGVRYNQQLNDKQKQDLWKYLPTKWNSRGNYASRVKSNSSYLSFQQLAPKEEGGEINPKDELLKLYSDYVNGANESEQAKAIYDKLNRVYHNEAKQNKMTAPNYILTKVMGV